MFDEEAILLDIKGADATDVLSQMADVLYKKDVVKDTYKEALLTREVDYPTGLQVERIGVAIPHTDAVHVNKDQIAFARLTEPVVFRQMGDGVEVQVSLVFMLALKEAHAQLATLQKLVSLIQDEAVIKQLTTSNSISDVKQILEKNI